MMTDKGKKKKTMKLSISIPVKMSLYFISLNMRLEKVSGSFT